MHVIQISESLLNQDQDHVDEFIHDWSLRYDYQNGEQDYDGNINQQWINLNNQDNETRLWTLFKWKFVNNRNGENVLGKIEWFANQRQLHANAAIIVDNAEQEYTNLDTTSPIYDIFFMHCLDRVNWPVYDQHTHRAMRYMMHGHQENFSDPSMDVYLNIYKNFVFDQLAYGNQDSGYLRKIDKALFAFGKFLKSKLCHEVDWN